MKTIDFSSKHNILLRNPDGTCSPMDEPYYRAEPVAPGTWKILSAGDYSYLVEGENEAVSIDTGYGAGNLREYLQTLTNKPVWNTFNTHSHFDHSANNGYFEKAYMARAGVPYASQPYASFEGIDFPQDYERVGVEEGFLYDLGGRTLEVFDIPDHTTDGIALLDRRERLLFTGDEFMTIGKRLNVPLPVFMGQMEKLMAHRGEFDRLCAGGGVLDASFFDGYYACAKQILSGNLGKKLPPEGPRQFHILPPGPNGETVYDRMMPHPGDHGPELYPPEPGYQPDLWALEYAGAKITYDLNKQDADVGAMEVLAQEFLHGNHVEPDHGKALYWAEKAARGGSARAVNVLGILALEGQVVPQDFGRAWELFMRSYREGDTKSPRYLGLMCRDGQYPAKQPLREAFYWFTVGAQGGDTTSQYYLGECYEKGLGTERDMGEAVKWYRLSARRDDYVGRPGREALERLGMPPTEEGMGS